MIEKTPNEVGEVASNLHANHTLRSEHLSLTEKWASEVPEEETAGIVNSPDKILGSVKRKVDQAVEMDKTFVEENAAALHDLAVTLAYLDGKTISVEEPLVIGRKAENRIDS